MIMLVKHVQPVCGFLVEGVENEKWNKIGISHQHNIDLQLHVGDLFMFTFRL